MTAPNSRLFEMIFHECKQAYAWVQGIVFAQAFILNSMPRAGTKTLLALLVQNGDTKTYYNYIAQARHTDYRSFVSIWLIKFSSKRLGASHL